MKEALNSSQQCKSWTDYPTREDEQRRRRQSIDILFDGLGERQVIPLSDFIVYSRNRVCCVAGFRIGTRDHRSVVSLAIPPETITIKVINAQGVLSIRFETFEEAGRHIDHMGDIDLLLISPRTGLKVLVKSRLSVGLVCP
jgi:hypothetical protein